MRRKGKRGEGLSRRKARVPRRGFRALGYVVRIERQFGVRGAGSPSRMEGCGGVRPANGLESTPYPRQLTCSIR